MADKEKPSHSLGGPKSGKASAMAQNPPVASEEGQRPVRSRSGLQDASEAFKGALRNDGKEERPQDEKARLEAEKAAKREIDRAAKVRATVEGQSLDPSLAGYLIAHASVLKDEEIDKMVSDFQAGLVVSHGGSTWGEPRPKKEG